MAGPEASGSTRPVPVWRFSPQKGRDLGTPSEFAGGLGQEQQAWGCETGGERCSWLLEAMHLSKAVAITGDVQSHLDFSSTTAANK